MSPPQNHTKIAYLAPEIPALSATFVYEEMYGIAGARPFHPFDFCSQTFAPR